jgi:hypothetical protein
MREISVYWDKETDLHARQDVLICVVNMEANPRQWRLGVGLALQQTDDGLGLYRRVGLAGNIPMSWIGSVEPVEIVIV